VASELPAPDLSAPVIDVPAASEASIDPWAAVDSAAQNDSPSIDEITESVDDTDVQVEDTSDVEEQASAARGLFSGEHIPEPPAEYPDAAPLAEDVNDAVPPRRGLFGR
jgi:hypothetical protein